MSNDNTESNSLLDYVGASLSEVRGWLRFLSLALAFVKYLRTKYEKQARIGRVIREQYPELRHEIGALSALSKSMERRIRYGEIHQTDIREIVEHVKNADELSRRLGLSVKDPPFDLDKFIEFNLEKVNESEPARELGELMFRELSRQAFKLASEFD